MLNSTALIFFFKDLISRMKFLTSCSRNQNERKLEEVDARGGHCFRAAALSPNMDQLVTRGCVRVPSLLWPFYSQSQLALCYFTCILLTIACHVPFFVDQRFVFSPEKRKFGHERYEISRKSDTHCLRSLNLGGKTRKFRRTSLVVPTLDVMPRVVPEQRQKFENDDLFRKMSRETEVN